jgi:hypothetical protein
MNRTNNARSNFNNSEKHTENKLPQLTQTNTFLGNLIGIFTSL